MKTKWLKYLRKKYEIKNDGQYWFFKHKKESHIYRYNSVKDAIIEIVGVNLSSTQLYRLWFRYETREQQNELKRQFNKI
jgi:hypothetical protein